mmetsp:Transcript_22207/g.28464  ORF Transcript_22207/g.28464 Transcript_22207/m.28464 type:complete len:84 (+) Transcript_22207:2-253(+)
MANMPPSIISNAKRKAKQLENFDYRKRSKDALDKGAEGDEHEASERTAAAMELLHKFKKLPVHEMDVEKMKNTLLPLLRQYGF